MPEVSDDFRVWTVRVQPGIYFQDDAAFKGKRRELVAEDYVYAYKRYFDPRWKSPALASLSELKMVGMAALRDAAVKGKQAFNYDTTVEGLRALDRYTVRLRLKSLNRVSFKSWRRRICGARWRVRLLSSVRRSNSGTPGRDRAISPGRLAPIIKDRSRTKPTYRDVVYDEEPNAGDLEGRLCCRSSRAASCRCLIEEITIIEEEQPRWLSFLNKEQDLIYRLPYAYMDIAAPNGKLAPNLARQDIKMYRTLASDVGLLTYFNMEDPVVGGYSPEKIACGARLAWRSTSLRRFDCFGAGRLCQLTPR